MKIHHKILAAILVTGITVMVFWDFFFRGMVPIPGNYMVSWYEPWKTDTTVNGAPTIPHKPIGDDVFRQVVPFKLLAIEEMVRGNVPLWNPYNGSGQPLLATIHSAYLNPFSYLLLVGNSMQGWSWYVIMQMVLTGFSLYLLGMLLHLSVSAIIVMVTTLLLSGFMTVRLEYGVYGYAMAALALLACGVELIRKKAVLAGSAVMVGATAFLLITVQPQIFSYILSFIIVYGSIRLWSIKQELFRFYLWIALGIGTAAPQLLPMIELYRMSNVTTDASRFIFERFLLPWSHLVTLGIPNYFGNAATYNWWGRGDFVQTMVSVGLIPTFLAAYIFFQRKRDPLVTALGWTVVITMFLTFDSAFTRWFYTLPLPIISTNIPSRMYIVTTFAMSLLSGMGYMSFEKDPRRIRSLVRFVFFLLIIVSVTALLWYMRAACPVEVPTCRLSAIRNTVLEIAVFTVFCIVSWLVRTRTVVMTLISVMLLFSVGVYNARKNIPFSEPIYAMPEHDVLSFARDLAPFRIAGLENAVFATDFATQYRYFDTNYYDPLYIRRYGELVSYVNLRDRLKGLSRSDVHVVADATVSAELVFRRERFWDMTGTSAMISKKTDDLCYPKNERNATVCDIFWENKQWQIARRKTALPRSYLVTDVRVQPDPDALLSELFSNKTDIQKTAFVETSVPLLDTGSGMTGSVVIDSYKANSVTMSVTSPSNALLVLSDTYYPGWRASVDGAETPIYRTNYTFRGIVVPKGTHAVRFFYDPDSFRMGLWVSGMSVFIWILIWFVPVIKSHNDSRRITRSTAKTKKNN